MDSTAPVAASTCTVRRLGPSALLPTTVVSQASFGAVSIAVLSFLGFDGISTLAEENRDSARSIGKAMIARAACKRGCCAPDTRDAIVALLGRYGLPTECPYPTDMLLGALCADKKIFGATLNLIVPTELGTCRILPIPVSEIPDWLRDGGAL